jgi:hypothetical protein
LAIFGPAKNLTETLPALLLLGRPSALMVNHEIAIRKCGFGLLTARA